MNHFPSYLILIHLGLERTRNADRLPPSCGRAQHDSGPDRAPLRCGRHPSHGKYGSAGLGMAEAITFLTQRALACRGLLIHRWSMVQLARHCRLESHPRQSVTFGRRVYPRPQFISGRTPETPEILQEQGGLLLSS